MGTTTSLCINSIPGGQTTCQVRAERTPGAVAVSQVIQSRARAEKSALATCQVNSELPLTEGKLFFGQGGVILDSVAKRSEAQNGELDKDCPGGFITGSCENGHRFAKEIYCGREWCDTCNGKWVKGKDMLPSHARRFARWYPKAQQISGMGYFTFTIPLQARGRFRTKQALGKLGHDIQELLRSYGFNRGLRRWHFFGDKSAVYHPHLNCLVDGRHIGKKKLRKLRREYSGLLGVKLAIAEYHYFESVPEKVHALKYVTRATFLDWRWDEDLARELHGFRNQLWWGSKLWSGQAVWSLDDLPNGESGDMSDSEAKAVASLENGQCPYDGLPIDWGRFLPISALPELRGKRLGAGYWELPRASPPSYRIDFSEYERVCYWREVVDKALVLSGLPPQFGHGLERANLARHKLHLQKKAVDEQAWSDILTGQGCDEKLSEGGCSGRGQR